MSSFHKPVFLHNDSSDVRLKVDCPTLSSYFSTTWLFALFRSSTPSLLPFKTVIGFLLLGVEESANRLGMRGELLSTDSLAIKPDELRPYDDGSSEVNSSKGSVGGRPFALRIMSVDSPSKSAMSALFYLNTSLVYLKKLDALLTSQLYLCSAFEEKLSMF